MKKVYNVEIKFKVGDKKLNEFISVFDLGINGLFADESLSFTTTTKPCKSMENKYIQAIKEAAEQNGKEIIDIQVAYSL